MLGSLKLWIARLICLRWLLHSIRRAASRLCCTAGKSKATRMAMMAITTRSSIRVKPRRFRMEMDLMVLASYDRGVLNEPQDGPCRPRAAPSAPLQLKGHEAHFSQRAGRIQQKKGPILGQVSVFFARSVHRPVVRASDGFLAPNSVRGRAIMRRGPYTRTGGGPVSVSVSVSSASRLAWPPAAGACGA